MAVIFAIKACAAEKLPKRPQLRSEYVRQNLALVLYVSRKDEAWGTPTIGISPVFKRIRETVP
jgi:hypothetical protein